MVLCHSRDEKIDGADRLASSEALAAHPSRVHGNRLSNIQDFELRYEVESLREPLSSPMECTNQKLRQRGGRDRKSFSLFGHSVRRAFSLGQSVRQIDAERRVETLHFALHSRAILASRRASASYSAA